MRGYAAWRGGDHGPRHCQQATVTPCPGRPPWSTPMVDPLNPSGHNGGRAGAAGAAGRQGRQDTKRAQVQWRHATRCALGYRHDKCSVDIKNTDDCIPRAAPRATGTGRPEFLGAIPCRFRRAALARKTPASCPGASRGGGRGNPAAARDTPRAGLRAGGAMRPAAGPALRQGTRLLRPPPPPPATRVPRRRVPPGGPCSVFRRTRRFPAARLASLALHWGGG